MRPNIVLFILIIVLQACSPSGTFEVDKGVRITIHHSQNSENKIEIGDKITLHMVHSLDDSLIKNTYFTKPINLIITEPQFEGDLMKGFLALSQGDSARIEINKDLYFKNSSITAPKGIEKFESLVYEVSILSITKAATLKKLSEQGIKKQIRKEVEFLQEYFDSLKIPRKTTRSLVFYEELAKGSSKSSQINDTLLIHCKGSLIDGTVFDNTFDQNTPYQVIAGKSNLLVGLEEGLKIMSEGSRYRFYIPSYLAYGASQMQVGEIIIPPHSILLYEVELLQIH